MAIDMKGKIEHIIEDSPERLVIRMIVKAPKINYYMMAIFLVWALGYALWTLREAPPLFSLILVSVILASAIFGIWLAKRINAAVSKNRELVIDKNRQTLKFGSVEVPLASITNIRIEEQKIMMASPSYIYKIITEKSELTLFMMSSTYAEAERILDIINGCR